jgi:hypothetical protein
MNIAAMNTSKSYIYLKKDDFVKAYGDETVLIVKDHKKIQFHFDCDECDASTSLLVSHHKDAKHRNVQIIGGVVKPTQLKLVNSCATANTDSSLLFCLDDMVSDDESEQKDDKTESPSRGQKRKLPIDATRSLTLFRRNFKQKKFLELDDEERKEISAQALKCERYKDKSIFKYINDKQLIHSTDYSDPDFISLSPPPDSEYNYSQDPPSVYDLFDIDIHPLSSRLQEIDYMEVVEYLDEDEEM